MLSPLNFEKYERALQLSGVTTDIGKVTQVTGFLLKGYLPGACIGSLCEIHPLNQLKFLAEVVGFQDKNVLLMPLGEMRGVGLGSKIVLVRNQATINVGDALLGRVINGMGEPIDDKGPIESFEEVSLYGESTNPLHRPPISDSLSLGVKSIDGLLTLGKGQRVGVMAGSGVGKSVLMAMMARATEADVNVIALVGERGREVREFIEHTLGREGLRKSIVIVATSDQSPLLRMRAAFVAATVSEYFSRKGKDVLMMMDSVTRFAMAQREIGLNIGEPPASKGYTPSVFSILPKLLERAGTFDGQGSITGLFTVLVEGDSMDDPIGDAVRSIVDGHIVLDRRLAQRGQFPAVDVLQSTSRVMRNVVSPEHMMAANMIRENLAVYNEAEDLINIGAYKQGSNAKIDRAIRMNEGIIQFLKQDYMNGSSISETITALAKLISS